MRTEQLRYALAGLVVSALSALPAQAVPLQVCADDGLCGKAQAIAPQQLDAVAGKFMVGGELVGLNLQMASSWQAANGQNLNGKANLALTLPAGGTPQARIQTTAKATEPTAASVPGSGLVSGAKGLESVNGAAQLVQIAGDANGASNLTSIDVSPRAIMLPAGVNTPSAEAIAANGAKVSVDFANNGVALLVSVPGAGNAQQRLNALGANNLLQSIQIGADRQQVTNQLQLQLQVRPQTASVLAGEGFGQALNMLRGR